jgi:hypothetical protein
MYHLQIELVILVKLAQVVRIDQLSCPLVARPNAVIEIAEPNHSFVIFD